MWGWEDVMDTQLSTGAPALSGAGWLQWGQPCFCTSNLLRAFAREVQVGHEKGFLLRKAAQTLERADRKVKSPSLDMALSASCHQIWLITPSCLLFATLHYQGCLGLMVLKSTVKSFQPLPCWDGRTTFFLSGTLLVTLVCFPSSWL